MKRRLKMIALVAALVAAPALPLAEAAPPQADASPGAQQLKDLPRKPGERVAVTIYEFRSLLPAMNARTATDMFTTAMVQSGQFRVVERNRLNEGVVREKQLQQSGWANGNAAQQQLRSAQYIFEGTVSEANVAESQGSGGINIAGMQIGGGGSKDSIAVDVRVVDAASGDVLDAVTVRKPIASREAGVSGVGNLIGTAMAQRGRSSPYVPDVQAQGRSTEGIDSAVRAAIEEAVLQLARRFGQ
jgi:curli biogenesis system outer membrane secretion channel CsgG